MSAKVDVNRAGRVRHIETVVDFRPESVRAPFFLRCGALLIDYILFISAPVIFLLIGRYMGNDGVRLVGGGLNDAGWLIAVLFLFVDLLILPMFTGRSIGKMIAGLRIVKMDGSPVTFGRIVLRNIVGYLLTLLTFGAGFLLSAVNTSGRSLHDYLAGTMVIYASREER